MSDINGVRERLERACIDEHGITWLKAGDLRAMLADHARLQKAMSVPTDFDQQDWAGQSGAVAWHLIDRHANNWGEVGEMMEQWRAANSPSAGGAAMSAPIIPAEQWPEWADRHCWDKNGDGWFYGLVTTSALKWLPELRRSNIPMPVGHDWHVPVMRNQPTPAIDLEQFWKLSDSWLAQAERVRALAPDKSTGLWAAAKELRDLLALIDGQANDNGVRVDRGALQMAINVLRRAGKDEVADALTGGMIEQRAKGEGE